MRKVVTLLAAAGMALTPVAAAAQDASALSVTRVGASLGGSSFLQDDNQEGGGSTAVILGVVLLVLIGLAAVSGNGSGPDNTPASP